MLPAVAALLSALALGRGDPNNPACSAALSADCGAQHGAGVAQCVGCVQAHEANLTAAKCSTTLKEKFCADAGQPPPPPPPPLPGPSSSGAKPADCPCVTWKAETCNTQSNKVDINDFIPAIYSAYIWHGPEVGCTPCSGHVGDFYCAWIFPCFADAPGVDIWGHRDFLNHGGVFRTRLLGSPLSSAEPASRVAQ